MQKIKIILVVTFFTMSVVSCSWFSRPKRVAVVNSSESIEKSKIVNSARVSEGGTVTVLAFKAGVGVEATEQLDRTSLEIIKGFADYLKEHPSSLTFVGADDAQNAGLVISGSFASIDVVSSLWPWAQKKISVSLTIDGKMFDPSTKETVAVFNFKRKFFGKRADLYQLGYLLGQDIGQFLVSDSQ